MDCKAKIQNDKKEGSPGIAIETLGEPSKGSKKVVMKPSKVFPTMLPTQENCLVPEGR